MVVQCKADFRCKDCLYCVVHNDSCRCHMGKPALSGFPKIDPDAFCGYFTEPGTFIRPYYKPFSDLAAKD